LKSTPAHDTVVAALSHKHHLIIHVGACSIQLANGSPLLFATELIHHRFLFSFFLSFYPFLAGVFSKVQCNEVFFDSN
jgi:hypothetical protein